MDAKQGFFPSASKKLGIARSGKRKVSADPRASQKLFIKVCRAFSKTPDEIRCVAVVDYIAMSESISEVPTIDDAFYYAFCGGAGSKRGKKVDLTSPEARKKLLMAIEETKYV